MIRHAVLVPAHRPVPLRRASAPTRSPRRSARGSSPASTRPTCIAQSRPDGLDAVLPDVRPQPARPRRRGADAARRAGRRATSSSSCRPGACDFAGEDPDAPENFPRVLSIWRANLLGSSAKGNEYFLKHLLGHATLACARTEAPRGTAAAATSCGTTRRPRASSTCCMTLDFRHDQHDALLRRRAAGGDLVREARPQHHRHAPVRALLQPGDRAAVADPHRLGRLPARSPQKFSRARRDPPRRPQGRRRGAARCTTPPTRWRSPHGVVRDWKAGECEPVPGETMPKLVVVERDYAAVAEKMTALGPLLDTLGHRPKGVTYAARARRSTYLRRKNGACAAAPPTAGRALDRDVHVCEAILALSGTTNGHLAIAGLPDPREAHRQPLADLAGRARGQADHLRRHPGRAGRR